MEESGAEILARYINTRNISWPTKNENRESGPVGISAETGEKSYLGGNSKSCGIRRTVACTRAQVVLIDVQPKNFMPWTEYVQQLQYTKHILRKVQA